MACESTATPRMARTARETCAPPRALGNIGLAGQRAWIAQLHRPGGARRSPWRLHLLPRRSCHGRRGRFLPQGVCQVRWSAGIHTVTQRAARDDRAVATMSTPQRLFRSIGSESCRSNLPQFRGGARRRAHPRRAAPVEAAERLHVLLPRPERISRTLSRDQRFPHREIPRRSVRGIAELRESQHPEFNGAFSHRAR